MKNYRRRIILIVTLVIGIATVALAYPLMAGGGSLAESFSGAAAGY